MQRWSPVNSPEPPGQTPSHVGSAVLVVPAKAAVPATTVGIETQGQTMTHDKV